ncbi:MAG: hypothetical protein A3D35_03400 [Candidatus Staskawiczbacteria bacterium RIFCSPHIGHO2_02_FULL_34_9]|uniref:Uncharacterized protein n=1 Tax=Candidatus Staskawiczbacteria bacterium RIFCSPHIGHO2_02_FULL_34_9 TaxID=1802206 RepID=A0A1G2I0Z6_9BACT|nr:MAG: hypothetical protein A3D35_03400 [Candidatus Staskawiczbacteria bacterium RIFCSPHIGHO2_02_FULL_34_9]
MTSLCRSGITLFLAIQLAFVSSTKSPEPRFLETIELGVGHKDPKPRFLKTIELGVGPKDADGFRDEMKIFNIDYTGSEDMMSNAAFVVTQKWREVDLVVIGVAELGFDPHKDVDFKKVFAKARKIGLELCPPDVAPQLQLQYPEQPIGEQVVIGMTPITDSDNNLGLFLVGRLQAGFFLESYVEDGLWLSSYVGGKNDLALFPDQQLVFVRPRK